MKSSLKHLATRVLCAVLLAALASGASALSTKVQAYYYTWYGDQNYEGEYYGWNSTGYNITCWPSLGIHSTKDPQVVHQHMRWLRDAGIGLIICNWDGIGTDQDTSCGVVTDIAAEYGIKVGFLIEPYKLSSMADYDAAIKHLIDAYGSKPAFYRDSARGNRPYIYMYSPGSYTASQWATLLNSYNGTSYDAVFIAESTNHTFITGGGWDGYFIYNVTHDTSTFASEVAWAASNNKLFVPPVTPGYDDTVNRDPGTVLDRAAGAYYDTRWTAAINASAEKVGIVTWNEWYEGTQIEPAIPYSNSTRTFLDYSPDVPTMYVDKTASWVGIYDAANSGLIQAEDYSGGSSAQSGVDYYDTTSGNGGGVYRTQDVDIFTCSEGGYCVANPVTGEWLRYTGISIPSAGSYEIRVRSASQSAGGSIQICDGSLSNVIATVSIPVTGSWSIWRTTSTTVSLTAGTHTFYIYDASGDFSLNWFDVRPVLDDPVIPQVDGVEYSPTPGAYTLPQTVSLSCPTAGSSIRYNVTGSGSYTTSYSTPLYITGDTTVGAIGYKPGYLLGSPTYGVYSISEAWDWQLGPDFTDVSSLHLWGDAEVVSNDDTQGHSWLRLTPDEEGSQGGAWTLDRWPTASGFVTEFTFAITHESTPGDGFCFAIQNLNNTYWCGANGPASNSVVVKFATYQGSSDPSWNSITLRGGGAVLTGVDLRTLGISLSDTAKHLARIEYAGGKMSVYVDGMAVISNYAIDLADYGAVDSGGGSFVGFAAYGGSCHENNYIADWRYRYLTAAARAATPEFSPEGGTYSHPAPVVITSATPGATIRYTTDGTIPSESSPLYSSPVLMSEGTLKAKAYRTGMVPSAIRSATYGQSWDWQYANFDSAAGLNLWGSTGCGIVTSDSYTEGANWLLLTPDQPDGGTSHKGGAWRTSMSRTVDGFVTEFGFKIVNSTGGMADGFCFSVQNNNNSYWASNTGPTTSAVSVRFDTFANTGEPGWNFVAIRGKDASGVGGDLIQRDVTPLGITLYDGSLHTARVEYGSGMMSVYIDGIAVITDQPVNLADYGVLNGDGYSYVGFCASTGGLAESNYIGSWRFKSGYLPQVATPQFSPDGTAYVTPQTFAVTMTCATSGAAIHYTTDGSTPDDTDTVYTSPVQVSTNAVLKAVACKSGYDASWVKTASYTHSGDLTSIAAAKAQPDQTTVACAGVVTACGPNGLMFIENDDRSCGIAVETYYTSYGTLPIGTKVQVSGQILTADTGERLISADLIASVGALDPVLAPVGMSTKAIGGGAMGLQEGVDGGAGLNNMGILARTWGTLNYGLAGCALSDGAVDVSIAIPQLSGIALDPDWQFVQVTGNIRCNTAQAGGPLSRVIQPRGVSDVTGLPEQEWDVSLYPDFTGDSDNVGLYDRAAYTTDASMDGTRRLRLTPSALDAHGQAFYLDKVDTAWRFDTKFTFQISDLIGGGADGLAFVMHNHVGPSASAYPGGTEYDSVAVKFDTYQNTGEPSSNFVAIVEGGYAYGVTRAAVDLTSLGINLRDLKAHVAEIIADPTNNTMSVKVDGVPVLTDIEVDYSMATCYDGNGQSWVGFAGKCGGCAEAHDIVNWRFRSASPQ